MLHKRIFPNLIFACLGICLSLTVFGRQEVMLEDISSNAAQYNLVSLRDGGLLIRNAGGNASSVSIVRFNNNQEPVWYKEIGDYRLEEQLFHYSVDEEYIYFFFERNRGFRSNEFTGRRNNPPNEEGQKDSTIPEQALQNGLSVKFVHILTGAYYERFFPTNNPIRFVKADVSWPNVMAYGTAYKRKILFNANFESGERNLISLNLDLYEDVHALSALPKSGGRFAVGLSNRVGELSIFDVDGLRPRLAPDNNYSLFLQADGVHAPVSDNEERYLVLSGRYRGKEGMYFIDLSQGLEPKYIDLPGNSKVRARDIAKETVETTRILKAESKYYLAQVHKKPYRTWFQDLDPFWDYSILLFQMQMRSPGNRESITQSKAGFYEALRGQLNSDQKSIIASDWAGMMLTEEKRRTGAPREESRLGPRFAGSFNPVLRLLSRKKVYSPSKQTGFSILELNTEGRLEKAAYFKQKKEKITAYRERLALNISEGKLQILASESEGIARYDWSRGTKSYFIDHSVNASHDARGFERLGFIGNKPISVWADFYNLGKGQGFSTTSTHKVEFYMSFGK